MPETPELDTVTILGWRTLPKMLTPAALEYFREYVGLVEYGIGFAVATGVAEGQADAIYDSIVNRRVPNVDWTEYQVVVDVATAHGKDGIKALLSSEFHERLLGEMLLCRHVDNFLTYLSDLLALIFRTRPETLRSGEQERLDFILQYQTMDDLVAALTEKRVEQLAYQGMRDLAKYVNEKLDLSLFESEDAAQGVARLVEERNVIVHNHGVVSRTMKKRLPSYPLEVGQRVQVDLAAAWEPGRLLAGAVLDLDARAVTKFKLPQVESEVLAKDFAERWSRTDSPSS